MRTFIVLFLLCLSVPVFAETATLVWTNNATNATGIDVERKGGLCASTNAFEILVSVGPAVATYVDTSIQPGFAYCYRVAAKNAAGKSPYSNTAELPPLAVAPAAPSLLGITRQP